ncbi:MAG TPA: hypothetical protein VF941_11020 [Clostridia bacterium]
MRNFKRKMFAMVLVFAMLLSSAQFVFAGTTIPTTLYQWNGGSEFINFTISNYIYSPYVYKVNNNSTKTLGVQLNTSSTLRVQIIKTGSNTIVFDATKSNGEYYKSGLDPNATYYIKFINPTGISITTSGFIYTDFNR